MKKVLIIAYYWPPAGGAGVQRVLKYAKYLPEFGWEPIILSVNSPDSPIEDLSLLDDISPNTKIYKTKALEPFNLYKKITGKKADEKISSDILVDKTRSSFAEKVSRWIRLNVFIPDAKIGWIPYAVKTGLKIIEEEKIDLIFSSSPPHTVQVIAKKLAHKSKLKWVADFRDPWLEIVHYQEQKRSSITEYIDRKLEKSVLKNADTIITISADIKKLFLSKVNNINCKIIPNGFDESDFQELNREKGDHFIIAYTGVINKTRVPYVFLKVLNKIINIDGIKNIKFVIAGNTCSEFNEAVSENMLSEYVELKGYLSHHESTNILQTSSLLLLIIDNVPQNKGFLTGKIFEYLGAKTPIFGIGPVDGDADNILIESKSGKIINYDDEDGAYKLLKEMYDDWNKNIINYKFEVEKYSRKGQTEELAQIFNEQLK